MNTQFNFFEHELVHLLLTNLVAIFLWWRYRDLRLILVAFLFGIFVDLDHWFDYFSYHGFNINFLNFFDVESYVEPSGKIYVLLHGWEFVIPFWLFGKWIGMKLQIKGLKWAVSLSYLVHLLWDNFSMPHHPLAYSFIFRLLNNFSLVSYHGY